MARRCAYDAEGTTVLMYSGYILGLFEFAYIPMNFARSGGDTVSKNAVALLRQRLVLSSFGVHGESGRDRDLGNR